MFYQYIRTCGHDIARRQLSYHVSRYYLLLWLVFYHASSCTLLCYHRRYVYKYEYAAVQDNQLAATYCINERTNRHVYTMSVVFKNA